MLCYSFSFMCFQGSYSEAEVQLKACLICLGRPLPTNKVDLLANFCWNGLRQMLHRIHVGRWLEAKAGGIWHNVSNHDIQMSARDAAYVYHKLLQLNLIGKFLNFIVFSLDEVIS